MGDCSFVADGEVSLFAVLIPRVREEVEAKFAERLAAASWFRRLFLHFAMTREIKRRLRSAFSNETLF